MLCNTITIEHCLHDPEDVLLGGDGRRKHLCNTSYASNADQSTTGKPVTNNVYVHLQVLYATA